MKYLDLLACYLASTLIVPRYLEEPLRREDDIVLINWKEV